MDILRRVEHRPWPLPNGPWVMAQKWRQLLFAHWPVPLEALRPLVPAPLEIETYGGKAWVGVVAFRLSGIRLRGAPEVGLVSHFPEVNVRTYVTLGGKPGVYFMSLDAENPLALAIARPFFRLAYYDADVSFRESKSGIHFSSKRTQRNAPPAEFSTTYRPCSPPHKSQPGTLEHWLTERYCYYSVSRSRKVYRCETHHLPWGLQRAEACIEKNTLLSSHGFELPEREPLLHYARYMEARIWPLRRVESSQY